MPKPDAIHTPASQGNDVLQSAAEPESAGNEVVTNWLAVSARWFRKTATLQTMIVLACLTSAAIPSAMLVSASTRTRDSRRGSSPSAPPVSLKNP